MSFWLNVDSSRVTLHLASCPYAVPQPKTEGGWTAFAGEEEAIASTDREVHRCGYCLVE